ncbi:DUF937 domain-containing protein [Erythrobacter sp. JK5]|uniref:DUF937 domain-containing protein n=1 Tax=Erythrobacter sp. JK5 TaxID=2829500 RepID=UPI001BA6CD1C|nr:DUF937 domain-containing protein [Erythrobacter sp. JK5]QUL36479.1 DUF937 domain-containing protein [Erythrobacter sp. JK5]
MSLAEMLQQSGAISAMARELGVDEGTAGSAAGALLPAIVAGMGRSATGGTATPDPMGGLGGLAGAILGGGAGGGGGGLGGALAGGLGGGLLDAVLGSSPTPTQPGNDILGNIFGSKDVSRSVAGEVASVTGLDEGLLKKMLPILAMAVAGYMAKQATASAPAQPSGGNNPLGGILGSIVSGMMR